MPYHTIQYPFRGENANRRLYPHPAKKSTGFPKGVFYGPVEKLLKSGGIASDRKAKAMDNTNPTKKMRDVEC